MTAPTAATSGGCAEARLDARASELARPDDDGDGGDPVDVLVVTVGGQPIALPVDALREVRAPTPFAPVPGPGGVLVGVIGGHGEALAVADLSALLGLAPARTPTGQWVVVLDDPVAAVGLLIDMADDIVSLDRQDLSPPPRDSVLIAAVADDGLLVLDAAALLADPRLFLAARLDPTEVTSWHDA